jgi:cell division protein FtsA
VPLAAARAVLTKRQKELGIAVVDIGGGTTGLAVYEEGDVLYSSVLPVGAGHVTNDLAIGLRTDIDTAERIKLAHVRATYPKGVPNDMVVLEELGPDAQPVSRRDLQEFAGARLEEIFKLVQAELKKVGKDTLLPGGVVLTGGGAKMPGMDELAREILHLPAVIGKPTGFTGIVDRISDPAFAAPVGLMLENMSFGPTTSATNAKLGQTVDKIKESLRRFF